MAITRTQTASGNNTTGGTTVAATWPAATTNHSCLVAMVSCTDSSTTFTKPTNTHWISVKSVTGTGLKTEIFVWADAGIQSGAVTFTLSTSQRATMHIVEYAGASPYNNDVSGNTEILDGTTSATGTGTTVGASSSGTTTDAGDVFVSVLNQIGTQTFSAPTNSFSIVNQTNSTDTTAPGWISNGTIGGNSSKSAGTTVVITTTATVTVGKLIVVVTGWDNTDTTDGNTTRLSVTDSAGNTYTRAKEYTNTVGGAAGDGATAGIFYTKVTTQLSSGGTITVTSDTSRTAKAAGAASFTFNGTGTISVAGSQTDATDGADPAAMTISALSSKSYLWIGCAAREGVSTGATNDADYTSMISPVGTSGGSGVTNMSVHAAYRIFTGTTDTYDMGWTAADFAQVYVAFDVTITDTNQSSVFLERIPAATTTCYTQCTSSTSKDWLSSHITLRPRVATIASDWVYGSYAGAGGSAPVTGIGMRPDMIFTFNNNTRAKGVFVNSGTQLSGYSWSFRWDNGGVSALGLGVSYTNSDGFHAGTAFINNGGDTFHYHAFKRAWPTDSAFDYGQYMGDGTDPRTITIPFAPALVIVWRNDRGEGTSSYGYRTTSHSGDDSSEWVGTTSRTDYIQGISGSTFDVGSSLNASGYSYIWAAFADTGSIVEGGFKVGTYTATSGADNRDITVATGFVPTLTFNQNRTNGYAANARFTTQGDDKFLYFYNIAENSDGIQRTHANGFQVGTADNNLTNVYIYCCWIAAIAGSSPAGGSSAVVDPILPSGITPYPR